MDTKLRQVLDHDGPFTSVYLDSTHETEAAARELELRWRSVRERLEGQGAGDETLAALEGAVRTGPPPAGRAGRLLVAAGGTVVLDRYLPDPPPHPVTRVGELPYLLPLVESGAGPLPHVVALVDRVGADLRAVDAGGVVHTEHPSGQEHPVHKVRSGGWSHRNIQARAEETVRRNLAEVAAEIASLADRVGARLIVLAGDIQARAVLREALPARCQEILAESTGRRETGPTAEFAAAVDRLVAERRRAEHNELVDRFRAELDSGGLAVQGLDNAVAALREANAAAVVVGDLADTEVWTGTEPAAIALREDDLRAAGAEEVSRVRADEAVPAAALRTGAELVSATGPLADGIGVLLRHN